MSEPMGIIFEFVPQVDRFQFLFVLRSTLPRGFSRQVTIPFFAALVGSIAPFLEVGLLKERGGLIKGDCTITCEASNTRF